MKILFETRNAKIQETEELISKAELENRSLTDEEMSKIKELQSVIKNLQEQIEVVESTKNLKPVEKKELNEEEVKENMQERNLQVRAREEEMFIECLKEGNTRALTVGANGGLVPQTVAERIVETVSNNCPMINKSVLYKIVGDFKINVQDGRVSVGFPEEMAKTAPTNVALSTKTLKSNAIVSAIQISNLLINDSNVNVVDEVVRIIANDLTAFINDTLVIGATGKVEGLIETTNVLQAVISLDSIIALMMKVPVAKHKGACFIMSPNAFATIRQEAIKAGVLAYSGMAGDEGMTLFGKSVYLVDAMAGQASECVFANLEGYAVKMPKQIEVKLLHETYALENAIGVVATAYIDGCVINNKLIAKLVAPSQSKK